MIIPPHAMPHAVALLIALQAIENPTEEQRRFIGALKKAQGLISNNDRTKRFRGIVDELAAGPSPEEVKRQQDLKR